MVGDCSIMIPKDNWMNWFTNKVGSFDLLLLIRKDNENLYPE